MKAIFTQDFANNWQKNNVVEIKPIDIKSYLVDGVAVIDKNELEKVADIYDDNNIQISKGEKPSENNNSSIKRLLYLESELNNRIHNYINEYCLRNKTFDPEKLKDTLLYIIDDNINALKQNK